MEKEYVLYGCEFIGDTFIACWGKLGNWWVGKKSEEGEISLFFDSLSQAAEVWKILHEKELEIFNGK